MKNAEYKGRTYNLTEQDMTEMPNMKTDLIKRGFNGTVYYGNSQPVGRQRKEMNAMFFCDARTGEFVNAI